MERYWPLLLDVWREACSHIAIDEAVQRITPILARRMPLQSALLRRIDPERRTVETIGVGGNCDPWRALPERTGCSAAQLRRLLAWCRAQRVLHRPAAQLGPDAPLPLLPAQVRGDALAGPLRGSGGRFGMLILIAGPGRDFDAQDAAAAQALLAPFSTALENDARLRELTLLRAAAEADRESLLKRLGRPAIADAIVGADGGLKPAMQRVRQVAPSDLPVLLLGETGSGKEVLARAIHAGSPRAGGPFLRVNCGAIPPELIDSELFGHERGSFTGAVEQRRGWFEQADHGSLFLDEVAELPLAAQVRLLRILQDGTFTRVGGEGALTVDVRVIAATHRDLSAMVAAGRFREDLWYRLAVFPIRIPPLRERPDDIPALARHFALRAARRFGTPPLEPDDADVALLRRYAWPGNARELQSVMERAVILGEGRRLEIVKSLGILDAPAPPVGPAGAPSSPAPGAAPPESAARDAFPTLNAVMRAHIESALVRSRGKVDGRGGAAELLGINPHTLRGRMRKLGIRWADFRRRAAAPPA